MGIPPLSIDGRRHGEPDTLELRIGIIKADFKNNETEIITPLLRANAGFPHKFEIITEFEFRPEEGDMGDGAAGIKWIPLFGDTFSFGNETLALLPVRPGDKGIGIESQFLTTYWRDNLRIHVNAGVIHDSRTSSSENGWRSSLLTEFPRDDYRIGVELFAKDIENKPMDARAGIGIIYFFDTMDVRSGLHVGLSRAAPDISFNFWISTNIRFFE